MRILGDHFNLIFNNSLQVLKYLFILCFFIQGILFLYGSFNTEKTSNSNSYNLYLSDEDDIFGDFTITQPKKSDILLKRNAYIIFWDFTGGIEYVTIALFNNFNFVEIITLSTTNDGSFDWNVSEVPNSDHYEIGIWDCNDFMNYDFSDDFSILDENPTPLPSSLIIIIVLGIIGGLSLIIIMIVNHRIMSK